MSDTNGNRNSSKNSLVRIAALCVVTVILLSSLIVQRIWILRSEVDRVDRRHEQIRQYFKQEVKDDPEARKKRPFETPDYLDEKPFSLTGDFAKISKEEFNTALEYQSRIRTRKLSEAGDSLGTPLSIPLSRKSRTLAGLERKYQIFRNRELKVYNELSKDKGAAKQVGQEFLKQYILYMFRNEQSPPVETVRSLAHQVFDLGVTDPMVRTYAAFIIFHENGDVVWAEKVWADALKELRLSDYPRLVQVYLRAFAMDSAEASEGTSIYRRDAFTISVIRWLEEDSSNSQWAEAVHRKLDMIWRSGDRNVRDGLVAGCLQSEKIDPFIKHWLIGRQQLDFFWRDGGGIGEENEVTKRIRTLGIPSAIEKAKVHLEYAWWLRPNSHYAPTEMIHIATYGEDRDYRPRDWFRRAVEARFDYWPAYHAMLRPLGASVVKVRAFRIRGNLKVEDYLQFARLCLKTNRFDTMVPYFFLDIVDDLRRNKFDGDWDRLASVGADKVADEFLAARRAYRKTSSNERLAGDNPFTRGFLCNFMQRTGRVAAYVDEFRQANGNVELYLLQERNRLGGHSLRLAAVADGNNRKRVLSFDRRLLKRWPHESNPETFANLKEELKNLEIDSSDPVSHAYYKHAERILSQMETYHRGNWVQLDFSGDGLGWEFYADDVQISPDGNEVTLARRNGNANQVWARPLAYFEPPFILEAEFEHQRASTLLNSIGIHRTKPEIWKNNSPQYQWNERVLFSGIQARSYVDYEVSYPKGRTPVGMGYRESLMNLFPNNYSEEVLSERKELKGTQSVKKVCSWPMMDGPQSRTITWRLWPNDLEYGSDGCYGASNFSADSSSKMFLGFGEGKYRTGRRNDGSFRLRNVRIRKMTDEPPPNKNESFDVREEYWTQRVAIDDEDFFAHLQLCHLLLESGQVDQALHKSVSLIERWPELIGSYRIQGLALFQKRDYQAALQPLDHYFQFDRDNIDVCWARGEIFASAPSEDLRDGREALNMAHSAEARRIEKLPRTLALQAAALAELGRFEEAVFVNRKAIEKATGDFQEALKKRQALYEAKQPYRMSGPT